MWLQVSGEKRDDVYEGAVRVYAGRGGEVWSEEIKQRKPENERKKRNSFPYQMHRTVKYGKACKMVLRCRP